jgi:hypothetical protein
MSSQLAVAVLVALVAVLAVAVVAQLFKVGLHLQLL